MAHLLLFDVPGGNDFTVLQDAVSLGHQVTLYTSDLEQYRRQGKITLDCLALAREVVEIRPFDYAAFEARVLADHARLPFDAVLCLIDIRNIEASRIAQRLGLRFLNPETARLMRDKFSVRETLARHGVRQSAFALAENSDSLRQAVAEVGYPALVKPADGYASQNVAVLFCDADLAAYLATLAARPGPTDYGLGVFANNRFSVERYVQGNLIGCDVFVNDEGRHYLGINDKLMYPPPSFAIRGSCFPSDRYDRSVIQDYVDQILSAVNFDFGAAHVEMIMTADGPFLVEVNPRLVSAQIPYQMGYALGRSLYGELINLHLGHSMEELAATPPSWFSAIRWVIAHREGLLESLELPESPHEQVRRVVVFKAPGDMVKPPINNGDRIAYVIAVGETQVAAEQLAEQYVQDSVVSLFGMEECS